MARKNYSYAGHLRQNAPDTISIAGERLDGADRCQVSRTSNTV